MLHPSSEPVSDRILSSDSSAFGAGRIQAPRHCSGLRRVPGLYNKTSLSEEMLTVSHRCRRGSMVCWQTVDALSVALMKKVIRALSLKVLSRVGGGTHPKEEGNMRRFFAVCFLGVALIVACSDNSVLNPVDSENPALVRAAKPSTGPSYPPPDLVSWWPLDETSGTTAADIVGPNSGTHVGGPQFVAGKVCGALDFAAGQRVEVPYSSSFIFTDWTAGAWIKTLDGSGFRRIINQQVGAGAENAGTAFWILGLENNKLWACSQTIDGAIDKTDGSVQLGCVAYPDILLNDGQFHHVAVTNMADSFL